MIEGPPIPPRVIDDIVLAALEEDAAQNDVTTAATVEPGQWGRGTFVAKDGGVIAGLPVAAAAMTALDEDVSFDTLVRDGQKVAGGTPIAEVEGRMAAILSCERVALNFLQRLSGIATLTRAFADAVQDTNAVILDTRKTTPGWRALEKYAVRAGGGFNHRMDLATAILIKDNHLAACDGDVALAVKRVRDVVRIFARIRKVVPATLLMIGDGPERGEAEREARELHVDGDVRFLGRLDTVSELLGATDLFLLPSQSESFGLAALEAMACGAPVIASRAGGLPEVIVDGVNGILEPPGSVEAMARRAIDLLRDTARYEAMSTAAAARANDFRAEKVVPQYEALYTEVLG